jgi:hypothetical protein
MSKIHEEDKKIFNYVLDKLLTEVSKDISKFSSDMEEDYEDMDTWDDDDDEKPSYTIKGKVRTYSINWNGPNGTVHLKFTPVYGTVSIRTPKHWDETEVPVGWGAENKDIKIKFMKIWHTVNSWEAVELPRQKREKFINSIMSTFPNILDHIILGGEDDEEEK